MYVRCQRLLNAQRRNTVDRGRATNRSDRLFKLNPNRMHQHHLHEGRMAFPDSAAHVRPLLAENKSVFLLLFFIF